MRTDSKLAALSGLSTRTPLHDMLDTLRRAINPKPERRAGRLLRDIDGWSDQSDVAFLEETCCRKA